MKIFKCKQSKLPGRSYNDIERAARSMHNEISRTTKRNPYIKAPYFGKDKIFIDLFWSHLNQKTRGDRKRRLKFYGVAIELLQNSRLEPISRMNPNGKNEVVHRFGGITSTNELFYVQVKEDVKTGRKYFMSVFSSE